MELVVVLLFQYFVVLILQYIYNYDVHLSLYMKMKKEV